MNIIKLPNIAWFCLNIITIVNVVKSDAKWPVLARMSQNLHSRGEKWLHFTFSNFTLVMESSLLAKRDMLFFLVKLFFFRDCDLKKASDFFRKSTQIWAK